MSFPWIFFLTLLLLASLFLFSPQGQSILRILFLPEHRTRFLLFAAGVILFLAGISYFIFSPPRSPEPPEHISLKEIGSEYLEKLAENKIIVLDSAVSLREVSPEIAYIIPSLIQTVPSRTPAKVPRITEASERSVSLIFADSRPLYSRALRKTLEEKLGAHYRIQIRPKSRKITVQYRGVSWNAEQILSLPVVDAALTENLDPVLLMAWVKTASDFNPYFQNAEGKSGLLALDSGSGLEQLRMGAHLLRDRLDLLGNIPDALASVYLGFAQGGEQSRLSWRNDPLVKTWVEQVLKNAEAYRESGLGLLYLAP